MADINTLYKELTRQYAELTSQHATLAAAYADLSQEHDVLLAQIPEGGGYAGADDDAADDDDEDQDEDQGRNSRRQLKKQRSRTISENVKEEDLYFFQIRFSPEVMRLLSDLFMLLDTQGQGFVTEESFVSGSYATLFTSFGTWAEIKDWFDEDGNNMVDPQEFVTGFARVALNETVPSAAGSEMAVGPLAAQLQALITQFATDNIMAFHDRVAKDLAEVSGMQHSSSGIIPSEVVYSAFIDVRTIKDMSDTFKVLLGREDGVGSITPASFTSCGLSLGDWDRVKMLFDADDSGTIEEKEFLDGFKGWCCQEAVSIPAGNPSIKQILDSASAQANSNISTALAQFKESLE